jgi:DNA-binding protein Fis
VGDIGGQKGSASRGQVSHGQDVLAGYLGGRVMVDKILDKAEVIARAICDIEDVFLLEKNGNLHSFIIDHVEKPMIENLLAKTDGNQLKVAHMLGINRNTLRTRIRKLGIDINYFKGVRSNMGRRNG